MNRAGIYSSLLVATDYCAHNKESLELIFQNVPVPVLFSCLSRLIGKKMIDVSGRGEDKIYKISDAGSALVNDILKNLKTVSLKKGYWMLILSSATEEYRVERDKIRSLLISKGFGLLSNGSYIGYVYDFLPIENQIAQFQNSRVFSFRLNEIGKDILNNRYKIWDIAAVKKLYQNWIEIADRFIQNHPENEPALLIHSRVLVYDLARIIDRDPKFHYNDLSSTIGRDLAIKLYQKIRGWCY